MFLSGCSIVSDSHPCTRMNRKPIHKLMSARMSHKKQKKSRYVRKNDDGSFEPVHHRLIGIASREETGSPPRILCQGMGRVEAMLDRARRELGGAS